MKQIYLDYNATTPLLPEVVESMQPYLREYFGNPSSGHLYGIQTRQAVEKARAQVARLINVNPEEIIFTSGGTESNNYALKGTAFVLKDEGNHIITSQIEHPAVLEVCKFLEKKGFRITYLPVDNNGRIRLKDMEEAITDKTILISIMHANNETGTIQPISEIGEIARSRGIRFHTDAAQSLGKIPVNASDLKVDLLSIAGHKLYAPKGVGALYIKQGTQLEKLIHGANHESDLRAGTENVLEIVGLGKACEIALKELDKTATHLKKMRDLLWDGIKKGLTGIIDLKLNGHPELRLPNTLNVCFTGLAADEIILSLYQLAISAGAACHSSDVQLSHVLEAMQVPVSHAMGAIRFSTGKFTTEEEITKAVSIIINEITDMKSN